MDHTFLRATIVFAALAVAGVALTVIPPDVVGDNAAVRALGPALLGAGLLAGASLIFRNQPNKQTT